MTCLRKWLWWMTLTTLGFILGAILGIAVVSSLASWYSFGWWWLYPGATEQPNLAQEVTNIGSSFAFLHNAPIAEAFIFNLFSEGLIGMMIGLFQSILIRKIGIRLSKWLFWTFLGFLLPHIFHLIAAEQHMKYRGKHTFESDFDLLLDLLLLFMCVLSAFASLGFFQWLEIRKVFSRSWLWILGTSVGMLAYWYLTIFEFSSVPILSNLFGGVSNRHFYEMNNDVFFMEELVLRFLIALFSGCFLGIFSGIAFISLKHKNPQGRK